MAIASCLVVSNIYYNQPLLSDIMREFHVSQKTVGTIPIFTQLGYALGLLLIVPLGDMIERKKTILISLALALVMLVVVAVSPNMTILIISSLFLGIFSVVPQLLIPFAAHLANPAERGKVVGTVMSGLLLGILLSRTLAGQVEAHFGWRMIYWIATGFMVIIWTGLYFLLPTNQSSFEGSYGSLLKSIVQLIKDYPSLRESAIIGALLFGALNLFWSTLVFVLKAPPYQYSTETVGWFGLLGAVGALGAPVFGRMADKKGPRTVIFIGIGIELISFIILFFFGFQLAGMVIFVVLMDLGQQSAHISNQTKVFALNPAARNRLNTVYMFTAFSGAATGSAIGSFAFATQGLRGICIGGFLLLLAAMGVFLYYSKRSAKSELSVFKEA